MGCSAGSGNEDCCRMQQLCCDAAWMWLAKGRSSPLRNCGRRVSRLVGCSGGSTWKTSWIRSSKTFALENSECKFISIDEVFHMKHGFAPNLPLPAFSV